MSLHRKSEHILAFLGRAIYSIRWGMIPMYLGLWAAILGYNIEFFREGWEFFFSGRHDSSQWLLFLINALDMTMIGNLVVMVTTGGYSTFVREFLPKELGRMPRWMIGLTSTSLKIKMAMSLAAVSGVHLLRTFINMSEEHVDLEVVKWQVIIHVIFLVSFLAYAFYEKYLHTAGHTTPHDDAAGHTKPHNDAAAHSAPPVAEPKEH